MKLTKCESNPKPDPYHRSTGGVTWTKLFIDPELQEYGLVQEYDDYSQPIEEWTRLVIVTPLASRPDQDAAQAYLEGDEAQALVGRIIQGWHKHWDGSNMVGILSDDAVKALFDLRAGLEELPENRWSVLRMADIIADVSITGDESDDELLRMVDTIETYAASEHIIIADDDVFEYLKKERDRKCSS